jgi:hypothetical protein
MSEEIQSIGLDYIISIGAAVAAGGAMIFSALTYRRNKKSEQIKIAREEMDKISSKVQRLVEIRVAPDAEVSDTVTSQLVYLFHVEEVMKGCEYFGYLIRKKVIEDDDIIGYYKPEITKIFVEVMSPGRDAFQKMNDESQRYPYLLENIEGHIKLVDKIVFYWG